MGCCHTKNSTVKLKDDEQVDVVGESMPLKNQPAAEDERPMSSTIQKIPASRSATPQQQGSLFAPSTGSGFTKPAPLQNAGSQKNLDPNALNTTPQSKLLEGQQAEAFQEPPKDYIEPVRNDPGPKSSEKKEAVRMFIPWEQPALGKKPGKVPDFSSAKRKRSKKKESKGSELHQRGLKQQVFIPGTGKERILMAGSKQKKSTGDGGKVMLKPLTKIKGDASTKNEIQKARAKAQESKSKSRVVNKSLAEVCGIKDKEVWRLVRQYAEIGRREEQQDMILVVDPKRGKENDPSHVRTVIKCPIRADAP